jgi:hypothetical protein
VSRLELRSSSKMIFFLPPATGALEWMVGFFSMISNFLTKNLRSEHTGNNSMELIFYVNILFGGCFNVCLFILVAPALDGLYLDVPIEFQVHFISNDIDNCVWNVILNFF